jgi:predicted metalloprotease with PDZ domain
VKPRSFVATVAAIVSLQALPAAAAPAPAMALEVDLREAPRRIFHVRETLRVPPGPLTLAYPKWIPGTHRADGPAANVAGLRITAGGKPLAWSRDPVELHLVRCAVPRGAGAVEIAFDYLSPVALEGFTEAATTSARLAVLEWNLTVLYPHGASARELQVQPSLRLPAGWQHASALEVAKRVAGVLDFKPVSLETLVDSPVLAGAHLRSVTLDGTHTLAMAADSPAALDAPAARLAAVRKLVAEAGALFGVRHYRHYTFLLALSELVGHTGLEHHESTNIRGPERMLVDDDQHLDWATIMPHEYAHSWNGKHRRPAGLHRRDYVEPQHTQLLWVYEGLTSYLGYVLAARSGLFEPEAAREDLAFTVGWLMSRPGRQWRPLGDTATAAPHLYSVGSEWSSWRRGVDFYPEGVTLWLEVDALIRTKTRGARSLDDFCRAFFGGAGGAPSVRPFVLDDLLRALGEVAPHDWRAFFAARVDAVSPRAPLDAVAAVGWKLEYPTRLNKTLGAYERAEEVVYFPWFSLGLRLKKDGYVADVAPGTPAAKAGVGPGMKLVAVDGRKYSATVLRDALRTNAAARRPIELLLENGEFYRTHTVDWRGGDRQPHLVRDAAKPDLLSAILKPLTR